ncbi:DMT family transporter [Actinomycetospora endophytica]|uniref:DMT family transporter n=1 Tax=Actinomycetospora endophytica TaxID=2291215 RepID=A0ABS8P6Y0_9PSEU|nr:DMT family transporter [Actinomycetospora endophytica]MCD2194010.1 DMT family transporter [Actinomycetospora endophytica]
MRPPAPGPPFESHPVAAVLLALCSAFLYALAAALQRLATSRAANEGTHPRDGRAFFGALARMPLWWTGLASMGCGAAVHVVALGLGSVTLVQPVGVLALVLALPLDARLEHRTIRRAEWASAALLVAGLAGLLTLAPHHGETRQAGTGGLVATALAAAAALVAIALVGNRLGWRSRAVSRAAGAGLCAGVTSGLVRPVLHGLHRGPLDAGVVVAGIAVLVLPVIGVLLLQLAYRDGGLDAGLATQTTIDPVVAGLIGILVLDERFEGGVTGAGFAVLCAAVTVVGLVALIRAGPTPAHGPG